MGDNNICAKPSIIGGVHNNYSATEVSWKKIEFLLNMVNSLWWKRLTNRLTFLCGFTPHSPIKTYQKYHLFPSIYGYVNLFRGSVKCNIETLSSLDVYCGAYYTHHPLTSLKTLFIYSYKWWWRGKMRPRFVHF